MSCGNSCKKRSVRQLLLVNAVAMQPSMRQVSGVETKRNEQESIKLMSSFSCVCFSTPSVLNPKEQNRSDLIQRLIDLTTSIMIPKSLLTIFLSLQSLEQPSQGISSEYDVKVIDNLNPAINTGYGQVSLGTPQDKEVVIQAQTKYPVSLPF